MEYRIIRRGSAREDVVAVFDSAYAALEFLGDSWYRGEVRRGQLYLIDSEGTVLLQPADFEHIGSGQEAA